MTHLHDTAADTEAVWNDWLAKARRRNVRSARRMRWVVVFVIVAIAAWAASLAAPGAVTGFLVHGRASR